MMRLSKSCRDIQKRLKRQILDKLKGHFLTPGNALSL